MKAAIDLKRRLVSLGVVALMLGLVHIPVTQSRDFFAAELPLRVTFESDSAGQVIGMLIYPPRGQKAVPASRVKS